MSDTAVPEPLTFGAWEREGAWTTCHLLVIGRWPIDFLRYATVVDVRVSWAFEETLSWAEQMRDYASEFVSGWLVGAEADELLPAADAASAASKAAKAAGPARPRLQPLALLLQKPRRTACPPGRARRRMLAARRAPGRASTLLF